MNHPEIFTVTSDHEAATVVVDDKTGFFAIESTLGSFIKIWYRQDQLKSLRSFLAEANFDDIAHESFKGVHKDFDLDGSIEQAKEIVFNKFDGSDLDLKSQKDKRYALNMLNEIKNTRINSKEKFLDALVHNEWICVEDALGDLWKNTVVYKKAPELLRFQELLWPHIQTRLRVLLSDERRCQYENEQLLAL